MDESILDQSCSCFLGHAPCSFCTDTYECESCGTRVIAADEEEAAVNECICTDCLHRRENETGWEADDNG